jgi:hypothetical protein
MEGAHLFIGWPAGSVLEYFSYEFQQELQSYLFLGLPSQVLESAVLPARMNLFLQQLTSMGQPMCGRVDSHQAFFPSIS